MDIYQATLAGLVGLCGTLYAVQQRPARAAAAQPTKKAQSAQEYPAAGFFVVYALVMAADWLQGPYLYSLYADEHAVAPAHVPLLFATGFVAGGLSATVVGRAADRHGRKRACLTCCGLYAASCALTAASPRLPVLLAGRALGGVSTSLLFSVFESWMVADVGRWREKHQSTDAGLAGLFGRMGTLNSLAAIASGVFSEWAVGVTGTRKAPFVASALLLVTAGLLATRWTENYGDAQDGKDHDRPGVWALLRDPVVLALGLASTLFEGSMYLFVFFWTPALQAAAAAANAVPLGLVFASFMAAAMAATLAFDLVVTRWRLVRCAVLLIALLAAADGVFAALSSAVWSESATLWLFCLFDACVGTYWPCMGLLKGHLIDDAARAHVYALLRVPLNVFVVLALLRAPDAGAYASVFAACAALLLLALGGVLAILLRQKHLP